MMRILVIDDEKVQREALAQILLKKLYHVETASDGEEAIRCLNERSFDVVITDFRMPQASGLDVARHVARVQPQAATFIMTAYADVFNTIESFQAGIVDYLLKPINVESLLHKLSLLQERLSLQQELGRLRQTLTESKSYNRLLGESLCMKNIRALIEQVAESKGSILITGETGTGKEVAARQIHQSSTRMPHSFIAVNCGAIPENLLESELFGYKKGAFTGAEQDKQGLLVAAEHGTLFLDEIGDMPKGLQVKLLRVLQERQMTPVGSTKSIDIDVRIIAATNRDLLQDIERGLFRRDLYYRINVVEIKMPALRDRLEDLPLLVHHALKKYATEMNKNIIGVSQSALQVLRAYHWPGNVRELENVIERAVILKKTSTVSCLIELEDLPSNLTTLNNHNTYPLTLDHAMNEYEKNHILRVLDLYQGDKKETARVLGLSLSSLYRKMEELGITHKLPKTDAAKD